MYNACAQHLCVACLQATDSNLSGPSFCKPLSAACIRAASCTCSCAKYVLQNIELLEQCAADQQEQYRHVQAQLAELQETQSSLDEEVQDASEVETHA